MCCRRRISWCIFLKVLIVTILALFASVTFKTSMRLDVTRMSSQLNNQSQTRIHKKPSFSVYHGPAYPLDKVQPALLPSEVKKVLPKNPPAILTTSIPDNVKGYEVGQAYNTKEKEFFWGKTVRPGDYVQLIFVKAVRVGRVAVTSGAPGHEADKLLDTTLQISTSYNNKCDNKDVKQFHNSPLVDYTFPKGSEPLVHCVRLVVNKVLIDDIGRPRWLIIRDIKIN